MKLSKGLLLLVAGVTLSTLFSSTLAKPQESQDVEIQFDYVYVNGDGNVDFAVILDSTTDDSITADTSETTTDPSVSPSSGPETTTDPSVSPSSGPESTTDPSVSPSSGPETTTDPSVSPSSGTEITDDPSASPSSGTDSPTKPPSSGGSSWITYSNSSMLSMLSFMLVLFCYSNNN